MGERDDSRRRFEVVLPDGETGIRWSEIYWSSNDLSTITRYLRDEEVETVPQNEELGKKLARRVGVKLRPGESERVNNPKEEAWQKQKSQVDLEAEKLLGEVKASYPEKKVFVGKDVYETEDEWYWTNKLAGRAAMQVVWISGKRNGLLNEDYRDFAGGSNRRKTKDSYGLAEGKSHNIWEVTVLDTSLDFPSAIREGETSSKTLRAMGHEVGHFMRVVFNKNFWREVNGSVVGVMEQPDGPEGTTEKWTHIGGREVGSMAIGGEAAGDFLASIVEGRLRYKRSPSLAECIPMVANRLKLRLDGKDDLNHKLGDLSLLHHLLQLNKEGFGDIDPVKLLSLLCCGYVSLEKQPEMILGGVTTHEKTDKVEVVIRDLIDWMAPISES